MIGDAVSGPMRVGLAFPHAHVAGDVDRLRQLVTGIEELGLDHLNVFDHVLGADPADREPPLTGPYDQHDPFHEPLVLFGYLAAITTRLELATAVLVLPQRPVALVAKQAIEVDRLSGGRLRLGVGVGWNHVEYESLGATFRDRGDRLDDQLALLRRLWDEPLVTHRSPHHRVERAGLLPRPTGPLALWLGGYTAAARRRAVRWGDGFSFSDLAGAARDVPRLREELAAAGRDPAGFGFDVLVHHRGDDRRWREDVAACRRLGATHVTMAVHRLGDLGTDALLAVVERGAGEVRRST